MEEQLTFSIALILITPAMLIIAGCILHHKTNHHMKGSINWVQYMVRSVGLGLVMCLMVFSIKHWGDLNLTLFTSFLVPVTTMAFGFILYALWEYLRGVKIL